jgi:hypothetical protein
LNGTYATTGSNTFAGIQTINSNLIVTGSITAQTLVVQTITSSVDFVTGSTRFGSLSSNTMQVTGSMNVSGSGSFLGSITAAALSRIGDVYIGGRAGTYAGYPDGIFGDNLHLGVTGTGGAVYINTLLSRNTYINPVGGSVGIGTASPGRLLDVSSGGDTYLRVTGNRGNSDDLHVSNVEFYNSNSTRIIAEVRAITGTGGTQSNSGQLAFYTNNAGTYAERMRITNAGNVLIGNATNSILALATFSKTLTGGYATANNYLQIGAGENGVGGTRLIGFGYSITANTNQPAYVGYIETSNTGETKGSLIFGTRDVTTDTAPTERMRITEAGVVQMG